MERMRLPRICNEYAYSEVRVNTSAIAARLEAVHNYEGHVFGYNGNGGRYDGCGGYPYFYLFYCTRCQFQVCREYHYNLLKSRDSE